MPIVRVLSEILVIKRLNWCLMALPKDIISKYNCHKLLKMINSLNLSSLIITKLPIVNDIIPMQIILILYLYSLNEDPEKSLSPIRNELLQDYNNINNKNAF